MLLKELAETTHLFRFLRAFIFPTEFDHDAVSALHLIEVHDSTPSVCGALKAMLQFEALT